MVTYILAFILFGMPEQAPDLIAPFKERDACMSEAQKMNATNPSLRTREARELGAEYVCLKVERVQV